MRDNFYQMGNRQNSNTSLPSFLLPTGNRSYLWKPKQGTHYMILYVLALLSYSGNESLAYKIIINIHLGYWRYHHNNTNEKKFIIMIKKNTEKRIV